MKILEIIPGLVSGVAERFTVDLCNELSLSHDVTLIVLYKIDDFNFYASEVSDRVKIISLNKKPGLDWAMFYNLHKTIKVVAPDAVLTHLDAIIYSFLSIIFSTKIKYFHTVHNDAPKEAGNRIPTLIRKYCFKKKKVTPITISQESHRSFLEYYGTDAEMIVNGRNIPSTLPISNSVIEEFKNFRKDNATKVLVNLARFSSVKRQTLLAKIADRLNKEGYNFTLLFIGNNNKVDEMVNEIKSYKCSNIQILGERKNPLEYLKMADAYALCSSYEGMPISLIEAMGVGAVPVCTPVGGIVDIIKNGINGFISGDISEESYYNTLKEFLDSSDKKIEQLRMASLKSYEPYSMTECCQNYIKIFSKK